MFIARSKTLVSVKNDDGGTSHGGDLFEPLYLFLEFFVLSPESLCLPVTGKNVVNVFKEPPDLLPYVGIITATTKRFFFHSSVV